ncbi:MAG: hypothetical protein LBP22_04985 [Deltaproteobacteria bacterium]|jgi:hypothetical protein|nr:hypothetical protein [Deltaproteobacteria bacterium]
MEVCQLNLKGEDLLAMAAGRPQFVALLLQEQEALPPLKLKGECQLAAMAKEEYRLLNRIQL